MPPPAVYSYWVIENIVGHSFSVIFCSFKAVKRTKEWPLGVFEPERVEKRENARMRLFPTTL